MTTSLGIAATTAVLRRLLQNAIPAAQLGGVLGPVVVSALPPDRINVAVETSQLNLFMYQIRPNTGWSNNEFPSHGSSGRRLTSPPLALDLSYMLSAYGAQNFHGEILLGHGALLLHQTRVLTRDAIKATFAGGALPADLALLSGSGLDSQEEIVSLSMESLAMEEMSQLWQVFGEKYRPSIAFQAHVVLLRGTEPAAASGPPVQQTRLVSTTSINPTVNTIVPASIPVATGATIDLVGTGLLTPGTVVLFSSGESVSPDASSTPMQVTVSLPATLRAGVNTVRVQHRARFGADLRGGPESNTAPFILRPAFALTAAGGPDIGIGARVDTGQQTSTTITVAFLPAVDRRQRVALLLNEIAVVGGAATHSYAIDAPSREKDAATTTGTIAFTVDSVQRANYLVRLQVDGAETELGMTGGVYDQPAVDLT